MDDIINKYYKFEGTPTVQLLRSHTNDVYLVKDTKDQYILKVYFPEWRTEQEIIWELDLLNFLSTADVPVAKFINSHDGSKLIKFQHNGLSCIAVLFEYAEGDKPQPPFTPELYYQFGKAAANFHKKTEGFSSSFPRPELDLKYLINDSVALAKDKLSATDFDFFEQFGTTLKSNIDQFIEKGLDWGVVHGDLTLDNLHVTDKGEIIFYDFDSSGLGFRAMELQAWSALHPEFKTNTDAYLKGYQEIKPIDKNDLEAAPYLQAAQDMWLRTGMKTLSSPELLQAKINKLKQWSHYFNMQ